MFNLRFSSVLAMGLVTSTAAIAQSSSIVAVPATPAPVIAPVKPVESVPVATPTIAAIALPAQTFLKAGTPVSLRTLDSLTTKKKKLKVGDRFQMEVAEAIVVENAVIIPAGSRAVGEVTLIKNKGMWGKRGRLSARALYLRAGERQVRLSGSFDDAGSAGTAGVVGAVVVLPLAGFFVTGTSAEIPSGTTVKSFLDEDLPYSVAAPVSVQPAATLSAQPVTPVAPPVAAPPTK
jgi:hypothetical protein